MARGPILICMKFCLRFNDVSFVSLAVSGLLLMLGGTSFAQQSTPSAQPPAQATQASPPAAPDAASATAPATTSATSASPAVNAAQGGVIHGLAKSGNMPLPGATITATNTLTGQKVTTWTDVNGQYGLEVPSNGRYVVRAQMSAFSPLTQEVLINAANHDVQANLEMVLLSRAQQAAAQEARAAASLGSRGFQSLQVTQGEGGGDSGTAGAGESAGAGNFGGAEVSAATESVAVSGNISNSSLAAMSPEAWQQRIEEMRAQNGILVIGGQPGQPGQPGQLGGGASSGQVVQLGGFGGGFGGPGGFGGFGGFGGGGGRGGGGRGRFDFNKPHGSLYYSIGDSALNAAPYALAGRPVTQPDYIQQHFGGSIGGPLNIPRIYNGGSKTFFFLNYNGTRGKTPYDQYSTVPTLAERGGDFSALPNAIFDPTTNTQFQGNMIPSGDISPIAMGLLPYIPLPNVPGTDFKNFHYVTSALSNSDDLNFRLNRSFGAATTQRRGPGRFGGSRNNLSIGIHYHGASANQTNPFPTVGGSTDTRSMDIPVSYTRSFGKLVNIARMDFNRSRVSTRNLYAFNTDITGTLGINGVSTNPFDWGLPTLSFGDLGSLQDITPLLQRNQTWTFADSMIWTHGKHTLRWGGDFRRIELNAETDSDPRGSFAFSGINTQQTASDGSKVQGTGFDFADFLLGMPQQTAVQYGQNDHFRGNSWDYYVQDELRLRGNLTFNLGVRYEYVSPFIEINSRIANLAVAPQFLFDPNYSAANPISVVTPGQPNLPDSLMHPDRNNFAPRVGLAWKPFGNTVVRAGYGINYNTQAYQNIIQQLAFQPPFSVTQTNVLSTTPGLTLQNGFPTPPPGVITNNYGVDPNYRVGYVQIWNLDIQQQIRPTLLLNVDYVGTKGTALDMLTAPNRTIDGVRLATAQAFDWETDQGFSTAQIGMLRLRKRLQGGFSLGGTYTLMKAIDDASSIGGSARVVAQNPFDLAAERSLSSFDQKNRFTGDFLWELPFGHDRRWLRDSSPWRAIFGDWLWTGDWTFADGVPLTPRLLNSAAELNRGTNGTQRPNVVPGQSITLSNPSIGEWFNTAAFTAPGTDSAGNLLYGDARRNSIIGPGSRVFDMALTKQIPLRESRVLEFRATASNVFNTPQYSSVDTTLGSPTFGQVIAVGNMRSITLTTRFRF